MSRSKGPCTRSAFFVVGEDAAKTDQEAAGEGSVNGVSVVAASGAAAARLP